MFEINVNIVDQTTGEIVTQVKIPNVPKNMLYPDRSAKLCIASFIEEVQKAVARYAG